MKIDGYIPASLEIALEQGVTFTYPTAYGDILIRSKMAGRDNVAFRLAMQNFDQWMGRRRNLTKGTIDNEADERLIGIVHDHLVIAWSTTVKSEGKEIAPTRENFISLLSSPATAGVLNLYMGDAADEDNFRAISTEDALGNSRTPSDGQSSGAIENNGSGT